MPFPGEPWSFPGKDERRPTTSRPTRGASSCRCGSACGSPASPRIGVGFVVDASTGRITCDNVVVATGTFGRTPTVPDFAKDLDPSILQLHSSEYRRPGQLRDGPVLVVGASHSGTDIAYEAAETRPTTLVGRDNGEIPVRLESRRMKVVFPVLMFLWKHLLTRRTPDGPQGDAPPPLPRRTDAAGEALRPRRARSRRATRRASSASRRAPVLADGTVVDVANVVWATGFRQDFDWIDLPVFGEDGWPTEFRGVVDDAPGLFFCGLSFQYAFSSMLVGGAGRDAEYVARRIAARTPQQVEQREPKAA